MSPATASQASQTTWPEDALTPEDRRALRIEQVERIHALQDARERSQLAHPSARAANTRATATATATRTKQAHTVTRTLAGLAALTVIALVALTVIRLAIIIFATR
ncbi:hypothetical protein ABIB54_000511 [Frigoribacterium sp. UYMn621]